MDLASAQQNTPATFGSNILSWAKWRYSPIAEVLASSDAENAVRNLNFPSVAHFLRPFFTFTEPVSLRGVNEQALPQNSLHVRLLPLERVREADASIRSAFFTKSLAEIGEAEFAKFEKEVFPVLRRVASQCAHDDDLASSEVALNNLLPKDLAYSAHVRDSLTKSQKSLEDAEAAGVDPATITQPPLDAPKVFPGLGVASSFSSSITANYDLATSTFMQTAETLLKTSYQPWFATFIRDYHSAVRFSHFDPVDHPVAQIFVVTSTFLNQPQHPDCDIVRACHKMIEQSKTFATPGNPASNWPKWASISLDRANMCRIVFIIHDPLNYDVNERTVDAVRGRIASEICGANGGCFVLKMSNLRKRTRESVQPATDEATVVRPWANANSLYTFDDYTAAVERVQRQTEDEKQAANLEEAIKTVNNNTSSLSSLASLSNILANKVDYDELARNVNNALRITLFPYIDRRLRTMAAWVSDNRQSALGKFASSLFSSNKDKLPSIVKDRDNPEPRYRHDCLEMQIRRCADFSMAVQDYNSALNYYRMLRDELKDTLPSREFNRPMIAAAKEGIAVCLYLLGKFALPPTAADLRRDPEAGRFETARDDYRMAKCQSQAFRLTNILIQMCRESRTPSHERGVLQITPGAVVSEMTPLYQALMFEQLALFRIVSSPPLPILAGTRKWLMNYLNDGTSSSTLTALTMRPRSFALAMYDAAKRYRDASSEENPRTSLGRHSLRCALCAWHVLRFRCARSGSFPLLIADVAFFIAKRLLLDGEPLQAVGFICFALHACGWSNLSSSIQTYAVKQLKECFAKASERFGATLGKNFDNRQVMIHSSLPMFSYSLISVVSDGMSQDATTSSSLESSSTTTKKDMEVECERIYDDVRSEYSDSASILNVPRNLFHYKLSFNKPHSEKKLAVSHQLHHHDDLFVPKPSSPQAQPPFFYTTSLNEELQLTVGVRYRFPCTLRKVRLLYIALNKNDRDSTVSMSPNLSSVSPNSSPSTASSNLGIAGDAASAISDMLVGAGPRRVQHKDVLVASRGIDFITLCGNDQDPSSVYSFTLPITFDARGTYAVVGFRYEAELPGGVRLTSQNNVKDAILHNCLFPCLQLGHQLYHESTYLDNASKSISSIQCGEEVLMSHAGVVFSSGLPATHPSYLYVHVRAPTPTLSIEFCPPLPTACRNGELFSTQLVVKNTSSADVATDQVKIYVAECCGHMFAFDVKPHVPSTAVTTTSSALGAKIVNDWNEQRGDFENTPSWTRFSSSDEHPRQNTGGLVRITIPHLEPKASCSLNCVFRAQGNDFLKSNNTNNETTSSEAATTTASVGNDVAAIVLFTSWTVPKNYLSGKDAPAVSGAMIRCGRFYRRMLILPSISVAPRCVSLVSSKPMEKLLILENNNNNKNDIFAEKNQQEALQVPQVVLSIEVKSEKKQVSQNTRASQINNNNSKNEMMTRNQATTASSSTNDTFFVIDDITIISSGWNAKTISVPPTEYALSSPLRQNKNNIESESSSLIKNPNIKKVALSSRSVSSNSNWTCAVMLMTSKEESGTDWNDSSVISRAHLLSLDDVDELFNLNKQDDHSSSSSSSSSSDSSSSSSSSDDDNDDKVEGKKRIKKKKSNKKKQKKGYLDASAASLLHFCLHAPVCGTGVLGRPAIVADGLAFYADGNEKKEKKKPSNNNNGTTTASPTSPHNPSSPVVNAITPTVDITTNGDDSPTNDNKAKGTVTASHNHAHGKNNSYFDDKFPASSPSALMSTYEREIVCLPDKFSPNEKCPFVLRVSWREVSQHSNFDNSKKYRTIRRGVSFEVVRIGSGDLYPAEALFRFRDRLHGEATHRKENEGATAPLSPISTPFHSFEQLMGGGVTKSANLQDDTNGERDDDDDGGEDEQQQFGEGKNHEKFIQTKLLKEALRDDNPLSIPKIQCALSVSKNRIFSTFSQSGFSAEVPIDIAIANLSPFPIFVSVFATPRYSSSSSSNNNSINASNSSGTLPVIFSGRHAYIDLYLKPGESISNLKFVALALSVGLLDVTTSCFSFEAVNALIVNSTRNISAGTMTHQSSSRSSSATTGNNNINNSNASLHNNPNFIPSSSPPISSYVAKPTCVTLLRNNVNTTIANQNNNKYNFPVVASATIHPPTIVFGSVAGVNHSSSLVRIEAMRRPTTSTITNPSLLNNLSFTTSRKQHDGKTTVHISEIPDQQILGDTTKNSSDQANEGTTAAVPIRKRGERSSSRVLRSSDGSTFIPIKVEPGYVLKNPTATTSTSEKVTSNSEGTSSDDSKNKFENNNNNTNIDDDRTAETAMAEPMNQENEISSEAYSMMDNLPISNNINGDDDDRQQQNVSNDDGERRQQQQFFDPMSVDDADRGFESPQESVVVIPTEENIQQLEQERREKEKVAQSASANSQVKSGESESSLLTAKKIASIENITTSNIADFVAAGQGSTSSPTNKKKNRFESSSSSSSSSSSGSSGGAATTNKNHHQKVRQAASIASPILKGKTGFSASCSSSDDEKDKMPSQNSNNNNNKSSTKDNSGLTSPNSHKSALFPKETKNKFADTSSSSSSTDDDKK